MRGFTFGGELYGEVSRYVGVLCTPSEVEGFSFNRVCSASSRARAFSFCIWDFSCSALLLASVMSLEASMAFFYSSLTSSSNLAIESYN